MRRTDNHKARINASCNLRDQRRPVALGDVHVRIAASTAQLGTQCQKGFDHSWALTERMNHLDIAIADAAGSGVRESSIDRVDCRQLRVRGPSFGDRGIECSRRTERLIDCDQDSSRRATRSCE